MTAQQRGIIRQKIDFLQEELAELETATINPNVDDTIKSAAPERYNDLQHYLTQRLRVYEREFVNLALNKNRNWLMSLFRGFNIAVIVVATCAHCALPKEPIKKSPIECIFNGPCV